MEISKSELLLYYKRKQIQEAIAEHCLNKEVTGSINGEQFSKRPDTIQYPADILESVKQGITSFHCSEELWRNVSQLSPEQTRKQLDDLRIGWDLVLDIDCKELEYSKIAADLIVQALKYHSTNAISVKFSGNHGFHIAVPYESFPQEVLGKETRLLFPEAPRVIANYLKEMIKDHLKEKILELDKNADNVAKRFGKTIEDIGGPDLDPFKVLDIDTILISSRHLYRAPYSFNEKSGLVSVPIDPLRILDFDRKQAISRNILVDNRFRFIDRAKSKENEAKQLFIQAYDLESRKLDKQRYDELSKATVYKKDFDEFSEEIPEQYFPPCIQSIFKGMEDGKKRAVFILINFLKSCNWPHDKIDERLRQWNDVNKEKLRENYLVGQLRYQKQNKEKILPPNCDNTMYYKDLHICCPDTICNKIKNPVNYSIRKMKSIAYVQRENSVKRRTLTEQEKEQRRAVREEHKRFRDEMRKRKEENKE